MKRIAKSVARKFADHMATLLMAAVYFMLGFVMAAPYTLLAGWSLDGMGFMALVLPIASVILYTMYRAFRAGSIPSWIFWGFLGYCLLPIFMRMLSYGLETAGFAVVRGFVFAYRYESLIALPLFAFIGFCICSFARSVWRWLFHGTGNAPPSISF